MTHTIMLTTPFLLRWKFLSTIAVEHNFFLSNENHGHRSLTIQIAKMMLAKVTNMEDCSPKQRVIKLAHENAASQSSSSSLFQLAKYALFANRFNHQNAPFITSSKQHNLKPSNTFFAPLHDGILSSDRYVEIKTFHQQAHHLVIDKDVMIFTGSHSPESHQHLCKACTLCPQYIFDIKGINPSMNPSLRGNSEIQYSKQEPFS
ncbi:TPA: hypothetical protein VEO38_001394 [Providencia alcalifaciens]|nr:hypothetical protein [Providencia alcalifaciens]